MVLVVRKLFVALDVMRELFSVVCILGVAWCQHWMLGSCLMQCCRLGVDCCEFLKLKAAWCRHRKLEVARCWFGKLGVTWCGH